MNCQYTFDPAHDFLPQMGRTDNYIDLSYYCGWIVSMEIIIVDHTNFLVGVELTWVQDLKSSRKLSANTLDISYREKIA